MNRLKTYRQLFEMNGVIRTITDFVKKYIEEGDISEIDNYIEKGFNLGLGLVRSYESIYLMKKFLDAGADINYFKERDGVATSKTVLVWCVYNNLYDNVKFLLENGADPNLQRPLFNTLSIKPNQKNNYVDGDELRMIKILLEYGAILTIKDEFSGFFPDKIKNKEILLMIEQDFPDQWNDYQTEKNLDKFNI